MPNCSDLKAANIFIGTLKDFSISIGHHDFHNYIRSFIGLIQLNFYQMREILDLNYKCCI